MKNIPASYLNSFNNDGSSTAPHLFLQFDVSTFFSQVSVRNVYIFPGIPSLMEKAFNGLEHLFAGSGTTFHTREVTP